MQGVANSPASVKSRLTRVTSVINESHQNRKAPRGETPVNGISSSDILDEQTTGKGPNRFSTMKKAAEEQRRRVRETRSRIQEEEKAMVQQKKQEELKVQIRSVLEGILADTKKDIMLILQDRINHEKHAIRRDLKLDLEKTEEELTLELDKRLSNGESFEARVNRIQKEFEENFYRIVKTELAMVQKEMMKTMEQQLERDKNQWEENFRRDTEAKIRITEDNVLKDFKAGVDEAQKQCEDAVNSVQASINSLEKRLLEKFYFADQMNSTKMQETENSLKQLIDDTLDDRDNNLTTTIKTECDRIRQDIIVTRTQVSPVQTKCCTIL